MKQLFFLSAAANNISLSKLTGFPDRRITTGKYTSPHGFSVSEWAAQKAEGEV
jgi:hypothetical protein